MEAVTRTQVKQVPSDMRPFILDQYRPLSPRLPLKHPTDTPSALRTHSSLIKHDYSAPIQPSPSAVKHRVNEKTGISAAHNSLQR